MRGSSRLASKHEGGKFKVSAFPTSGRVTFDGFFADHYRTITLDVSANVDGEERYHRGKIEWRKETSGPTELK